MNTVTEHEALKALEEVTGEELGGVLYFSRKHIAKAMNLIVQQKRSTTGPVTFEQVAEVCNKKLGSLDFNGYGQVYFDKDQLIALINEFAVVSQSHIGTLEECARLRRNIAELELELKQARAESNESCVV